MELILSNIDLILCAVVIMITAVIFARRGQINLLRELILSLSSGVDADQLYARLPTLTKLLISNTALQKLTDEYAVQPTADDQQNSSK